MKLAQVDPNTLPTYFPPARFGNVNAIMSVLVNGILIVSSIVLLGMLLWGGYKFIIAGGDMEKFQQAKETLKYAILGFIVIITAYLLVKIITTITGVTFMMQ